MDRPNDARICNPEGSPEFYREDVMMKTDAQLQKDVMEELKWEPCVTASEIGVSVAKGVVTLNGTVPTYAEKWAAERAAQRVSGVKAIAEEIQIKPFGLHAKTDAEIAAIAVTSLKSHVWVPTDIQATVEDGWITLKGVVNWEFQRRAATDSVRFLAGVKGVSNNITLKATVQPTAIKDAIEMALRRNAETDARNVKVAADGGSVTLSGNVRSWSEKEDARLAAWNAPGVNTVRNDIAVVSA
jgi:osmotically-inducible protein OsmY